MDAEKLQALVDTYRANLDRRAGYLNVYRDANGDVGVDEFPGYDETFTANAENAQDDLYALVHDLECLLIADKGE